MTRRQAATSIADYEAGLTPRGHEALTTLRTRIAALLPAGEGEERLSYGIPTLFVGGTRVVHYAAWDTHLALYPIPPDPPGDPQLRAALTAYIKGKGTLHFPYAGPIPWPLVERVVVAHLHRMGALP